MMATSKKPLAQIKHDLVVNLYKIVGIDILHSKDIDRMTVAAKEVNEILGAFSSAYELTVDEILDNATGRGTEDKVVARVDADGWPIIREGDKDITAPQTDYDSMCNEEATADDDGCFWTCTLPRNHRYPYHVAGDEDTVCYVWPVE